MRIIPFIAEKHDEFGTMGLKMKGRHWADPLSGMAVAHDILEHFPNDDGSTEHELMALGASFFVRNGSAYYCEKGQYVSDPAENIAADMPEQCRYMDGRLLRTPPPSRRCRSEEAEEFFERTFHEARKLCIGEFENYGRDGPDMYRWIEREPFIGWLRAGYRRARRRYSRMREFQVCYTFTEIEKAADRIIARKVEYEGQQFNFHVDVRSGEVRTEAVYDDY